MFIISSTKNNVININLEYNKLWAQFLQNRVVSIAGMDVGINFFLTHFHFLDSSSPFFFGVLYFLDSTSSSSSSNTAIAFIPYLPYCIFQMHLHDFLFMFVFQQPLVFFFFYFFSMSKNSNGSSLTMAGLGLCLFLPSQGLLLLFILAFLQFR